MRAEGAWAPATDEEIAREAALVARARSDPDAFAGLYDLYVERIYRYAFRRLGTHEDAEDVTAHTFYRALERLDRYEWRGLPFGAWLFRIAHNLIVDRRRAGTGPISLDGMRRGDRSLGDGIGPPDPDGGIPDARLLEQEDRDAAWAAVATLPPLQRRAVTLRFGRDLSHAEVGVIIGRSEAATKQLIYRAMKTLRERLGVEP
jgi:RNA polymerase sigma-70 factor (ECF subfamily)